MKRILLILFVLITANAQAQYLKRYGGTGWTNTLHGEWFYNTHPSFGASDSLKIVDYAELWRAINVGGGGGGSAAIGSVVTGATQGSILYAGTGGILQQSNSSLFYDSTNNRVGIGTNTPSSRLDLTTTAIGVTQNNAYGISLVNPDAAAAGAQQMSPGLRLRGNGWKTNATAASQTVDWLIDVLPVQGAASPTSTLQFKSSINGAAYTLPVSFSSAGGVSATSASITSNVVAGGILAISTGNLGFSGSSRFNAPSDGILLMIGQSGSGFDRLQFGGTTSSFPSLQRSSANIIARLADNSANTDIEVLDEAYGAGWNGSNEVPTKNAVYDKIETLGGGITDINSQNGTSQTLAAGTWMGIVSAANNHTYSVNTTLVRADVDSRVKDSTGYYTAIVITSDATPTDMFFFAVPTGQLTTVIAQCNAIRTADAEGGYIGYKSNNLIKHAGGGISTSTVRSILADEYTAGASALSTATFTIQADGTTGGKITFTGEAGTGIKCQCRIQLNYVNAGL